jgi:inorganic pyrophosphatase
MNLPGPFSDDGKLLNVVIETPCRSRNKYAFDPATGLFKLRKILPAGSEFPLDMGFIPGTKGEDGDPLDALVWMDFPGSVGIFLECRLLGVMEVVQQEKNKKGERNDRFLFVANDSHEYADIRSVHDISTKKLEEIEEFFKFYNAAEEKKLRILGYKKSREALAVIKKQLYEEVL